VTAYAENHVARTLSASEGLKGVKGWEECGQMSGRDVVDVRRTRKTSRAEAGSGETSRDGQREC